MGGKGGAGKQQVTEYRLSMHFGVAHSVDSMLAIKVGDKPVWTGDWIGSGGFDLHYPDAFGGLKKEGGVSGRVHILSGDDNQVLSEELAQKFGRTSATMPGFRGLLSLFFTGFAGQRQGFYWSANSPYLKNPSIKVRRAPKGFYPEKAMIGPDANPTHIVYECLTHRDWGMGGNDSQIDLVKLGGAADVLYNEGLGLSIIWTGQSAIRSFVQEVLDHIEATFFLDPRTGLMTLKLIRNDYDPSTLMVLDPDNTRLTNFQRKSWGETINEINGTWTNPENEQEETVTVHDLGNISSQGGIVSSSRSYYGVRNGALAMRLAQRDLNVQAAPLASCDAEVNRDSWDKVPGDVVKVTWPDHSLFELVMRIGNIDYGRPGEPTITLKLVEDAFATPTNPYLIPPGTEWSDPSSVPLPLAFGRLMTAPFFALSQKFGDAAALDIPYPQAYVAVLAAQTGTDTENVDIWADKVNTVGETTKGVTGTVVMSSRATIGSALAKEVRSTLTSIMGMISNTIPDANVFVRIGGNDADAELAVIESLSETGPVIRRGILDTIPKVWPTGTEIWFFSPRNAIYDSAAHAAFDVADYQFLPRTSKGVLLPENAPIVSFGVSERPHLPLRPANVRINGALFGTPGSPVMSNIVVSWSNRNRLTETSRVLEWDAANVAPEAGQFTRLKVYDGAGTLLKTVDTASGATTYTISTLPWETIVGGYIEIEVSAVKDGLESMQNHRQRVTMQPPAGMVARHEQTHLGAVEFLFAAPAGASSVRVYRGATNVKADATLRATVSAIPGEAKRHVDGTLGAVDLALNKNFDTDSVWVKGEGWTIAAGKADKIAGVSTGINQPVTLVSGKTYRWGVNILTLTAGYIVARLFGTTNVTSSNLTTAGAKTGTLVANSSSLSFGANATSTYEGSIDEMYLYERGDVNDPRGVNYYWFAPVTAGVEGTAVALGPYTVL